MSVDQPVKGSEREKQANTSSQDSTHFSEYPTISVHLDLPPIPSTSHKRSDVKRWKVKMPPCNVTLCPVTFPATISILQKGDDQLTEAQGGDGQRSRSVLRDHCLCERRQG